MGRSATLIVTLLVTVVLSGAAYLLGRYLHAGAEVDELRLELSFLPAMASEGERTATPARIGQLTERLLELRGLEPNPGQLTVTVDGAYHESQTVRITVQYRRSVFPGWTRTLGAGTVQAGYFNLDEGEWANDGRDAPPPIEEGQRKIGEEVAYRKAVTDAVTTYFALIRNGRAQEAHRFLPEDLQPRVGRKRHASFWRQRASARALQNASVLHIELDDDGATVFALVGSQMQKLRAVGPPERLRVAPAALVPAAETDTGTIATPPATWWPLAQGNRWSYRVETETRVFARNGAEPQLTTRTSTERLEVLGPAADYGPSARRVKLARAAGVSWDSDNTRVVVLSSDARGVREHAWWGVGQNDQDLLKHARPLPRIKGPATIAKSWPLGIERMPDQGLKAQKTATHMGRKRQRVAGRQVDNCIGVRTEATLTGSLNRLGYRAPIVAGGSEEVRFYCEGIGPVHAVTYTWARVKLADRQTRSVFIIDRVKLEPGFRAQSES